MSLNDIYRAQVNYELPTSSASWSLYYKETIDASGGDIDTQIVCDAFANQMQGPIQDVLAQDCFATSFVVEKVFGIKEAKYVNTPGSQQGVMATDSLPNNAAMVIQMIQETFPANRNGRIRLPGVPQGSTNTGVLSNTFLITQVTAFINALVPVLDELSAGSGRFTPGIISAKVLNAAPPAKDWAGAFAPLTAIAANTIIGVMRKRMTRASGRAV